MTTKEELRLRRKEAYKQAKAARDADPAFLALKEKAKQERKAKYRAFRDEQRAIKRAEKEKRIAEKDAALMVFFISAADLEKKNAEKKRAALLDTQQPKS